MNHRCLRSALALHPSAAPAFDAWSALGELGLRGAAVRAVRLEGGVLAFTGFARLSGAAEEELDVQLEEGLTPAQVAEAAWEEVEDVLRLLAAPPRVRQAFARELVRHASAARLAGWGVSVGRALPALAQRLHAPLREEPAPLRIIDAILARRRGGGGSG